jgi:hypothetical protein
MTGAVPMWVLLLVSHGGVAVLAALLGLVVGASLASAGMRARLREQAAQRRKEGPKWG